MPAGLQIFNDSGTIQIDESWRNYGFRQIIPVGVTLSAPPGQTAVPVDYTLTVSGEAVLIAARSETIQTVAAGSNLSGSTWEFNWRFHPPPFPVPGLDYSDTIYFYVFDVMPSGGFSNIGMEVFNASSQRVFHSDMSVMKVRSVLSGASDYSGAGGRIFAPLVTLNPIRSTFNGSSYVITTRGFRTPGSTILTADLNFPASGFLEFSNYGQYAAVDVTGLA